MTDNTKAGARMPAVASGWFRLLSSYGLAVVLLAFLLVLTILGTVEQADQGLYLVQRKYFESLFLVHHLFGVVPVPLPGVYLLMSLLAVNLVCGAIIRAPKSLRAPGMLIAHAGILLLLAGGFVSFHFSTSGSMVLYEGQSANTFRSYYEWVVEIRRLAPTPSAQIWVIPGHDLESIAPAGSRTFVSPEIPFELVLSGFQPNAQPWEGKAPMLRAIDGVVLRPLPRDREQEQNIAGVYADVRPTGGGTNATGATAGLLWGLERQPWMVNVAGERWSVGLSRRAWPLPFTVHLDDFVMEQHPNTAIPRVFRSTITRIEGPVREAVNISMNAPLRHAGYTLFQATWGPQDAAPGAPLFSGFAVVRNPADQWPLISCIVVGAGMLIHFVQMLARHLRRRPPT